MLIRLEEEVEWTESWEREKFPVDRVRRNMERGEQSENSLQAIAVILLCCGAVKMLHLLGVISVEGESAHFWCVRKR